MSSLREALAHGDPDQHGQSLDPFEDRLYAELAQPLPSDLHGERGLGVREDLALAEKALTEIKIAHGLSDRHAPALWPAPHPVG